MPAGWVTAAIGAGTAIAGAVSGGSDVSSGETAANTAQNDALAQYSTNEQPYIGTGTNALGSLADADGLNGSAGNANALSQFQASPGYQYQLQQGLSAIDNGAASTGTLRSGNTIRAEETLGSNLANQDFGNYLGRLNSLAGLGQTATSALGSAGVSTGQGIASTDASGATAQAGIDGNLAKNLGTAATGLANSPQGKSALNSLFSPSTGPNAGPAGAAGALG